MTKTPATHKAPSSALGLGLLLLASPSRGAQACRDERAWGPALRIFGAFVGLSVLFYWWKPFDFPEKLLPFPREELTLFFWFKAMLVQIPFELALIAFTIGFVEWLRAGSFGFKLVTSVGWTAFALIVNIVAYVDHATASAKPLFAVGALAAFAPFYALLRKVRPEEWKPVSAFLLAINAIGIVLFVPMALCTAAEAAQAYKIVQVAGLLWLLGASTLGLRAATGLKLKSAFMAMLFGMCFQIALAFTLHLLGVPGNWLKAAMLYG